ncbi:MAG TPA: DUF4349 domain-containing protein [Acholeplasmataceae bacterium]|nr:DUF4349 domain-containing protein [Acholeplasmataceae bacterium]
MKKKLTLLLLLFISLFLFAGCSMSNSRVPDGGSGGSGASEQSLILTDPTRKIIYNVDISIKTKDLIGTTNEIKSKLNPTEDWVEKENLTDNTNEITLRVKNTRLNAFINSLKSEYETTSFKLESEDVSLEYADVQAKKQSLLATITKLEGYKQGETNINTLMEIDREIEKKQYELEKIERQILVYDQQVGFSTVKVYLYGEKASPTPPSYGKTLSNSFVGGWEAVVSILKFILQAIVTLIPFAVIVIPVVGIILGIVNREKIKGFFKKNKEEKEPKEEDK